MPPSSWAVDLLSETEQSTEESVAALPGDGLREGIVQELGRHVGDALVDTELRPQDDLWVRVRSDAWEQTGRALHAMGFHYFCLLSAIDWLPSPYGRGEDDPTEPPPERSTAVEQGVTGGDTRFQVLARVVDVRRHVGLTLKVDVPDDTMAVASWHAVYAGADWHERETHEMFGISFDGHPDLRNMYLPTDFEGHPLRKDFPLLARMVKPWPGIVDVEPMPTDEAEAEEDSSVSANTTETVASADTDPQDSPEATADPGEVTPASEQDAPAQEEPSPQDAPDEFASADEPDSGQESHANSYESSRDETEGAVSGSDLDAAGAASVRGEDSPQADAAASGGQTAADAGSEAAEGSASDEADAARDQSAAAVEPAEEGDPE
ncbi:hypothetical protein BH24ACT5_BH24ACT5_16660 [soil metagenome]